MIFSKFPFEVEPMFITFKQRAGIELWTSKGAMRSSIRIEPDLPPLVVINTHLQCGSGGEAATRARLTQIDHIRAALLDDATIADKTVLVGGDFNICARNEPDDYATLCARLAPMRELLSEDLRNQGQTERSRPVTISCSGLHPDLPPDESLDYLFLRAPHNLAAAAAGAWDYVAGSGAVVQIPASQAAWGVSLRRPVRRPRSATLPQPLARRAHDMRY